MKQARIDQSRERLHAVYEAGSPPELAERYARWAIDYDRDVMALGYQVPAMVAAMTARHVPPDAGPILDCGAGTGMIGLLLAALGYDSLVAIDLSAEMLQVAAARGVYESCRCMELGERLDFADDSFAAAVAGGVFTVGHAPATSFEEICRTVRPGGQVVFAVRQDGDHAAPYVAACDALERQGRWRLAAKSRPYQAFTLSREEAGVLNEVRVYRVA